MKINVLLVWYLREDLSHPLFQSIQSFFVEKAGRRQRKAMLLLKAEMQLDFSWIFSYKIKEYFNLGITCHSLTSNQ